VTLSNEQLAAYQQDGVVVLPDLFSAAEIDRMIDEVDSLAARDLPGHVRESGNGAMRALHGSHRDSALFNRLVHQTRLLDIARQVLGPQVYLHQFKINLKAAFSGEAWQWHQDYIFWLNEDGMPEPLPFSFAIFLDDVTEVNGPLYFIPGSQRIGTVDVSPPASSGAWEENFGTNLPYATPQKLITRLAQDNGIAVPSGGRGSTLMFHSNILHGSPSNISPFQRRLVILTYNAVSNAPVPKGKPRPEFLVTQDCRPITPTEYDLLGDI
jgi:ectoine hydroxylase-related dioxygenase (phytanoyl-CoA dioxygenase family)